MAQTMPKEMGLTIPKKKCQTVSRLAFEMFLVVAGVRFFLWNSVGQGLWYGLFYSAVLNQS